MIMKTKMEMVMTVMQVMITPTKEKKEKGDDDKADDSDDKENEKDQKQVKEHITGRHTVLPSVKQTKIAGNDLSSRRREIARRREAFMTVRGGGGWGR